MFSDLVNVVLSWILFSSLALLSLPILNLLLHKHAPDMGWAWGRVFGWLMISVPIWILAHLGIPINTTAGVWILFLGLLLVSARVFRQNQTVMLNNWTKAKTLIITEEILFAFGLLFLCLVRGYQPDINGLEKFMDAGLMVSYLNSPTLPIPDMWLAGFNFNYYTFGHFMGAIASQVIRQDIALSYNILLGIIMGLTLQQSFGILSWLLKKMSNIRTVVGAGVVGSLLVTVGGNTQHIWFFLKNGTFKGYWYPDATRFIPNTIHEFPSYSFIVSDLHAHVWSMVLVLLLIPLIFAWGEAIATHFQVKKISELKHVLLLATIIGSLIGLIASTSTWDTMIYGPLLGIVGVLQLIKTKGKALKILIYSAVLVILSALIFASPWLLNFESISEGVRWVQERSEIWRFLALWIGLLTCSMAGFAIALRKLIKTSESSNWQVIALTLLAWVLLIVPEIIFFKDIYPGHPRANTMFKLTFQAFIMMQLVTGWLLAQVIELSKRIEPGSSFTKRIQLLSPLIVLSLYIMAVFSYPYFGYRDYYGLKVYKGLDGLKWLETLHPNDFAAMEWLNKTVAANAIVLEAVGESYTTFSRVSAFTKVNTVLGWPVHEWLWRGSYDIPGKRVEEVKNFYNLPLSAESLQKLREYQVEYIFIGDKEREAYPELSLAELKTLGPTVFRAGETIVIEVGGKSNQNIIQSETGPIEWQ